MATYCVYDGGPETLGGSATALVPDLDLLCCERMVRSGKSLRPYMLWRRASVYIAIPDPGS